MGQTIGAHKKTVIRTPWLSYLLEASPASNKIRMKVCEDNFHISLYFVNNIFIA